MWKILTGEVRRGEKPNEPVALGTHLGYVLLGPISDMPRSELSSVNLNATHVLRCASVPAKPLESLETQVKRFWDLDSVGIMETDTVHETFKETITFDDGRYMVELPFQEFHPVLPDNFQLSVARLKGQLIRLRQQPLVLEQHDEIITKQLHDEIEEINPHNDFPEPGKVHYLPHHAVIREHAKTTKVRIVYDASAKVRNDAPSLNQCLKTGRSLIPTIFDILLRFRWNRVAVTADIKSVCLMINIAGKDRDFLRFLWVTNTKDEDPDIIFYRFKCVVFGLCSSPFLLNGTSQHHLSEYFAENPELLLILLKSFYVDDFLSGKDTKSETWKLCIEVRECLAKAGFNLHKWACSNPEIMNELNKLESKSSELVVSEREITQDDSTFAKLSVGGSAEGVNSSQDQRY